ncbi:MAG: hypothetical protein IPM16_13610 [Chloroflexi bacterium]|nr:hypothetical protein [Chloroflexota bacterium]
MTVADILQQAKGLSLQEQRDLVRLLSESIRHGEESRKHSILELAGLGADIWKGIDAQDYVDQLRREWDDRP